MPLPGKVRLLLIDDHQSMRRLFEAILSLRGDELLYAENGRLGIAMARQEQPDLILLDVMMPDLDGFKVCQYLKGHEETRDIPVMFLTARGAEGDLESGRRAGADGFMTKPFQTAAILAQIDRLIAERADRRRA